MKLSTLLIYISAILILPSPMACGGEEKLLFDRGLPTANINDTAGLKRSNVVWAAGNPVYLIGDDFLLQGHGQNYCVTKIRVWSTDSTGLSLWAGPDGQAIKLVSSNYTSKQVTYKVKKDEGNGQSYQGSTGGFSPLFELNFIVNLPVEGGKLWNFFLDGPPTPSLDFGPFLHSSNQYLSRSKQKGADDILLLLGLQNEVFTFYSSDKLWDKDSDANVQVFGTPVNGERKDGKKESKK